MNTLELIIQRKYRDSWPVVVERTRPGSLLPVRSEGKLDFDPAELLRYGNPRDYGIHLGRALFQDKHVSAALVGALAEARALPAGMPGQEEDFLRLLLFVEDNDLRSLHWERLCAEIDDRWDFLSLRQETPFSLYLPSLTDRRFPPIGRRDLRLLLLVASPRGLEDYSLQPFSPQELISRMGRALGGIPYDVLADVEGAAGPPTLAALQQLLVDGAYTMLHIVCHGRYDLKRGETSLFLAGPDGQVARLEGDVLLASLSRQGRLPHLVVLSSCQTADPRAEQGLGGLAHRMVRELGTPAVIAMTGQVSIATAEALSARFYTQLRSHGYVDRALAQAVAGLDWRYDITMPALFTRLGGKPLYSDALDVEPSEDQIRLGVDRLRLLLKARAPILSDEFEHLASVIQGTSPNIKSEPTSSTSVERLEALSKLNALCGEVIDRMSFNDLALGKEPERYDVRCPFRGLYPFRLEDREFFCGRESLIEKLVLRLQQSNFLSVLGSSGSGKSSLVLAGLLPRLFPRIEDAPILYMTPGDDPVSGLVQTLQDSRLLIHPRTKGGLQPGLSDDAQPNASFLPILVIDQFEELFTLCHEEELRQVFIREMLELVGRYRLILTMRADFWGECAPYPALRQAMQDCQELISPMDAGELRSAIEGQASRVGLHFEAGVADAILNEVQGEPGAMPLLQHLLLELWKRRRGRELRLEEYLLTGGVRNAITFTAEDCYKPLSDADKSLVRDIFLRLTRLDEEVGLGGERRDTRQRVRLDELVPAGGDPHTIHDLVALLANRRLVVTNEQKEVEVAHEQLIRAWNRLRQWLEEDREQLLLREDVRRAATEWHAHPGEESYLLHRGRRLQNATILLSHPRLQLTEIERTYLDVCQASERERLSLPIEVRLRVIYDGDSAQQSSTLELRLSRPPEETGVKSELPEGSLRDLVRLDMFGLRQLRNDWHAYGMLLTKNLFAAPAFCKGFSEACATAETMGKYALHINLEAGSLGLHAVAWELLCNPENERYLAYDMQASFSRQMINPQLRLRSLRNSMRVLAISAPDDQEAGQTASQDQGTVERPIGYPGYEFRLRTSAQVKLPDLHAELVEGVDILYLTCPWSAETVDVSVWPATIGVEALSLQTLVDLVSAVSKPPRLIILESNFVSEQAEGPSQRPSGYHAPIGARFAASGAAAVLLLPPGMSSETRRRVLLTFFHELSQHGDTGRALTAARQAVNDRLDWWQPVLYSFSAGGRLWYEPGFSGVNSDLWPALRSSIRQVENTPILGPGLAESFFGTQDSLARKIASRYEYIKPFTAPASLPNVAQFLSVSSGSYFAAQIYRQVLQEEIARRYSSALPQELLESRGWSNADFSKAFRQAMQAAWRDNSLNPYRLLAETPFPVYITTAYDTLLAAALQEAGREPQVRLLPWNTHLSRSLSEYEEEPTDEKPLVYHLLGILEEPESLVLTQDDYYDFLIGLTQNARQIPPAVRYHLVSRGLLFLGFREDDLGFQILLRYLDSLPGAELRRDYVNVMQAEPSTTRGINQILERRLDAYSCPVYWGSVDDFAQDLYAQYFAGE